MYHIKKHKEPPFRFHNNIRDDILESSFSDFNIFEEFPNFQQASSMAYNILENLENLSQNQANFLTYEIIRRYTAAIDGTMTFYPNNEKYLSKSDAIKLYNEFLAWKDKTKITGKLAHFIKNELFELAVPKHPLNVKGKIPYSTKNYKQTINNKKTQYISLLCWYLNFVNSRFSQIPNSRANSDDSQRHKAIAAFLVKSGIEPSNTLSASTVNNRISQSCKLSIKYNKSEICLSSLENAFNTILYILESMKFSYAKQLNEAIKFLCKWMHVEHPDTSITSDIIKTLLAHHIQCTRPYETFKTPSSKEIRIKKEIKLLNRDRVDITNNPEIIRYLYAIRIIQTQINSHPNTTIRQLKQHDKIIQKISNIWKIKLNSQPYFQLDIEQAKDNLLAIMNGK